MFAEVLFSGLESLARHRGDAAGKDLLWFVLSWCLRRRPKADREHIAAVAKASQTNRVHRAEAETMAEGLGLPWEQEEKILVAEMAGHCSRGFCELERMGCGPLLGTFRLAAGLPEPVLQRIESATDRRAVEGRLRQVSKIGAPDELDL